MRSREFLSLDSYEKLHMPNTAMHLTRLRRFTVPPGNLTVWLLHPGDGQRCGRDRSRAQGGTDSADLNPC